jgi:hypothetical protein
MKLNRRNLRKMIIQEISRMQVNEIAPVIATGALIAAPAIAPIAMWLVKGRVEDMRDQVAQQAWDSLDEDLKDAIIVASDAISSIPGLAQDAAIDSVVAMLESWKTS